ncbi:MAG TPA: tetratricopeptide repeat protein, partial [Anaeromyxobacteraceae bacterium]|nr:tetratricopeptide repeat protein [Anaeromyxobacteraceae bacterium]
APVQVPVQLQSPPPAPAPAAAEPPPTAQPAAPAVPPAVLAQRLLAAAEKRYETGDFAGAVGEYRRSLAAKPGAPGFVGLARALYDSNRSAEALQALDGALKLDGRYPAAWLLLGEIHQAEGRVPQARAAYERFLALQPGGEQAAAVRQILAKQLR